jgi:hypothetical protein
VVVAVAVNSMTRRTVVRVVDLRPEASLREQEQQGRATTVEWVVPMVGGRAPVITRAGVAVAAVAPTLRVKQVTQATMATPELAASA